MSGEYRTNVDMAFAAQRDCQSSLPLVEMCDDGRFELTRCIFSQEPCNKITENDSLVGLVVVWRSWDAGEVPEIAFPFVEALILRSCIKKKDARSSFDKPATVEDLDSTFSHRL